jgi:hypothetical protein
MQRDGFSCQRWGGDEHGCREGSTLGESPRSHWFLAVMSWFYDGTGGYSNPDPSNVFTCILAKYFVLGSWRNGSLQCNNQQSKRRCRGENSWKSPLPPPRCGEYWPNQWSNLHGSTPTPSRI